MCLFCPLYFPLSLLEKIRSNTPLFLSYLTGDCGALCLCSCHLLTTLFGVIDLIFTFECCSFLLHSFYQLSTLLVSLCDASAHVQNCHMYNKNCMWRNHSCLGRCWPESTGSWRTREETSRPHFLRSRLTSIPASALWTASLSSTRTMLPTQPSTRPKTLSAIDVKRVFDSVPH